MLQGTVVAPSSSSSPSALCTGGRNIRVNTGPEIFPGDTDLQPFDISGGSVGEGFVPRRRIAAVMAGDDAHEGRDIRNGPPHGPDLFERVCIRDQPVAGDPAIRGFQSHDPAECRRTADGAAGIRPECHPHHTSGNGRSTAAGRTARNTTGIMGVQRRAERGILGGGAHAELVHVRLSDNRCSGIF